MAFTSLAYLMDMDWLMEAYRRTRKDGATGVDGVTADEYEQNLESNLQGLLDRVKSGTYRAPPVRRVHIPKGGSRTAEQASVAATHTLRPTTQTTGHAGIVAPFLHEQIKPTPIRTRQAIPDAINAADRRPLVRVGGRCWGEPQAAVRAMVTRRALCHVHAVHLLGAKAINDERCAEEVEALRPGRRYTHGLTPRKRKRTGSSYK
jgi:hypothetical protein